MPTTIFAGATPLILFIAKATLVLIFALLAAALLRRGTAGERHLVWLAALVGILALPVLARIPALHIGVLPSALTSSPAPFDAPTAVLAPTNAPATAPIGAIERVPSENLRATTPLASSSAPVIAGPSTTPFAPRSTPTETLAIIWATVALTLLGWLAFGALQVRRIVAGGEELKTQDWTTPLCEVADRLDLEQPPRLVMSNRIEMAFACRALAPTIVLPAAAEQWTDDRRRAVLFHELAHVKRHDLVAHTLGRIACALYWFHPLVWTAAKKLRAESEKACDDLVLSCGARPSEYAQHLLDMVTSVRVHGAPVMALPMARKREFEGRMLAILDPAIRRNAPGRVQAAMLTATLGILSLSIAAIAPASPTAPAASASSMRSMLAASTPRAPQAAATADTIEPRRSRRRDSVDSSITPMPDVGIGRATSTTTDRATSRSIDRVVQQSTQSLTNVITSATTDAFRSLGLIQQGVAQGDTARIGLLIRVLGNDPDAEVRRSAAWALHDVRTPAARDALVRALSSDKDNEVREMCAWSLVDVRNDQAASALANALLHDKSAKVRQTAAWSLANQDRGRHADVLVSAISDPDPEVRQVAIWGVGQSDLDRAPASLLNALSDNSSDVREVAAWSLGQIRDSAAVRPLVRAFDAESKSDLKTIYLWALTRIGNAPTSVIESAMKSSDPELRRHAIELLAGSGGAWPWPWPWPQPRPTP